MNHKLLVVMLSMALCSAVLLPGQVTLNPLPSRVVGHPKLQLSNGNPNLVEGRELYSPQGVAVDMSASPPIVYVADTGNNRVLAWKNAGGFANGAAADFVIGQKDLQTTFAGGPGTSASIGLSRPTGLAVKDGNLYIADSGNNRILRFPTPATQEDRFPDMTIGQPNFNSRQANQGNTVPGRNTLALTTTSATYRCSLAFDSTGNLWVSDAGNHRVLRYPAADISAGKSDAEADLVLGQVGYDSVQTALTLTEANRQIKDRLQAPDGLTFDSRGNLYVADGLSRVLVFLPPFRDNQLARRVLGVVLSPKAGETPPTQAQFDRTILLDPQGLFMLDGARLGVVDGAANRILIYDPYGEWEPEAAPYYSPQARSVVGHTINDFANRKVNNGEPEAGAGTLAAPSAAVMAGGELYVADSGNHRVAVLPQQGAFFFGPAARMLGQVGYSYGSPNLIEGKEFAFSTSTSGGAFFDAGLAVDYTSDPPRLYVADTYNNRVLGFADVRRVRPGDRADIVIGQPDMFRALCNYPANDFNKPTASGLCRPVGLAVDGEGNLWVADSGNARVLRFPKPFAYEGTLPPADLVLGQTGFTSRITDPTAKTMAFPYGLAFAGEQGLLVSDASHNRILLFPKRDGAFVSGVAAVKVYGQANYTSIEASTQGSPEDNRFRSPRHIATDTDGRFYVADAGNNRVLIFDQVVNTTEANARAVVSLGNLGGPRGVYVSPQTGELWVTDTNSARALRYPRFDQLPFSSFRPDEMVLYAASNTLALAQDQYGDLLVADASNRVGLYYPGVKAVNAAHQLEGIALAPGAVAYVFPHTGGTFGGEPVKVTDLPNPLPWPVELGDIEVQINEKAAPLSYVSASQINLVVPNDAPTSGDVEFQVVRKSTGQILASGPVPMNPVSPGLFTRNDNGIGQVIASNADGSTNSATNPAAWGTIVSLYGTGQGEVPGAPADGDAPVDQAPTSTTPKVIMGPCYVDEPKAGVCEGEPGKVVYSGLAKGLVGTWQIDVQVPRWVAPSATVQVVIVYRNQYSNGSTNKVVTTIAVKQ